MCGSKPKAPKAPAPAPLPTPPAPVQMAEASDPAGIAKEAEERRRKMSGGTMLTGGQGVSAPVATAGKTLLGM